MTRGELERANQISDKIKQAEKKLMRAEEFSEKIESIEKNGKHWYEIDCCSLETKVPILTINNFEVTGALALCLIRLERELSELRTAFKNL